MDMLHDVSLANYSTMGLGGKAAHAITVTSRAELQATIEWAQSRSLPIIMIGSGSNVVWRDEDFPGLIIINRIKRYEIFEEDKANVYLTVGAGEIWDSVVERAVQAGLTGIEALSLIPGTAGAAPVQNIGAYGQELSKSLVTIEAFDIEIHDFVTLGSTDCGFGYRTSNFKTTKRGRFYISALTLHLAHGNPSPPFYNSLQSYCDQHGITDYTPASIRQAVIAIRSAKLPDPKVVRNTGSFFENPIISNEQFSGLMANFKQLPHWATEDESVKLSAAWLIEQAGFKDYHDPKTGMGTWPQQPLVLVNENATNTAALLTFKQKIIDAVQAKFGITLRQEPELLP